MAFRQACVKAGLDKGMPRGLRPGDLRHRFAVTRLVKWYREGANVQARLPLLATYLGHVRYAETAYYVTGTPELSRATIFPTPGVTHIPQAEIPGENRTFGALSTGARRRSL